jgi:hypothetical protein
MYEHHKQPLASQKVFVKRLANNGLIAFVLLMFSLGIGFLAITSLSIFHGSTLC